jgi:ATP-dependent Clp protease ATP-binding subunit ClpC
MVRQVEGRFSEATEAVVAQAHDEALRVGSGLVGTEHLLLGLVGSGRGKAAEALINAGATVDGCRSKVVELAGNSAAATTRAKLELSDRARRTLERADRLALRLRTPHVEPEHVLVSLLDVEGRAGQVLRSFGVDVATLRRVASTDATVEPEPVPPAEPAGQVVSGPLCPHCRADFGHDALAHQVVNSKNADGRSREFVIVYCAACGTSLSATPVPPRQR